jgi:hypothetical protein
MQLAFLTTTMLSLDPRPVLVLVVNDAYLSVFDNFIRAPAIPSLARWDVHLLCIDSNAALLATVAEMGWRCSHIGASKNSHRSQDVYTARMPHLQQLVASGRDVLISDLDALWLKDPLPELRLVAARAGIVSSRGLYPKGPIQMYGTAVCMGFVFFKGSDSRVRSAFAELTSPMHEDQSSFNNNLLREGVEWEERMLRMDESSTTTTYGRILAPGRSYANLSIAMLPHARFIRNCTGASHATLHEIVTIAHCHTGGKRAKVKQVFLSLRGLWWASNSTAAAGDAHPRHLQIYG